MKPILRLLLIAIVNLLIFAGCCCKKCETKITDRIQEEAPHSGYNVLVPDGHSLDELTSEIYKKTNIRLKEGEHIRRCPCDTSLVNINYPDLEFIGQDRLQVTTKPKGMGDSTSLDVTGFKVSKNFLLTMDDKQEKETSRPSPEERKNLQTLKGFENPTIPTDTVTVAIFDSGIDNDFIDVKHIGLTSNLSKCLVENGSSILRLPAAKQLNNDSWFVRGLNFAPADYPSGTYDISDITDRQPRHHGTQVAYLVTQQFKKTNPPKKALQLLVMKVLNNQNVGDAYGIMCAMYHARLLGTDVYNMSLGYYGPEDPIFRTYVEKIKESTEAYGKKAGWLVAAAGNSIKEFNIDTTTSEAPRDRDLDQRSVTSKFYPAYFSKSLDYVFSITTVDGRTDICPGQNYDKNSVDIGIINNRGCWFNITAKGTSFATPVAAGWLATRDIAPNSKTAILTSLGVENNVISKIRSGKIIEYTGP